MPATYTPRNVRPSFVTIEVEGRKADINTGPTGKNGTMFAKFFVRNKGGVEDSVTVKTYIQGNIHMLKVIGPDGSVVFRQETELD